MSKFIFRVSLEFKVTPTKTAEDDEEELRRKIHSWKLVYGHNHSPNLNAQIVALLESAGILARTGDCCHQAFTEEQEAVQ